MSGSSSQIAYVFLPLCVSLTGTVSAAIIRQFMDHIVPEFMDLCELQKYRLSSGLSSWLSCPGI